MSTGQVAVGAVPRSPTRVALTLMAFPVDAASRIITRDRRARPVGASTPRHHRSSSSPVVLIVASSMVRRLLGHLRPSQPSQP
ncbi:MAG TPA: hypothetical protein DCE43_05920, partial [Planctomycetaceae bacterium]|nr:hypothetical protein [Planctomycetaceae bacterium]